MEELVFAVPTDDLWRILTYKGTGLIRGDTDILNRILNHGLFRKRREAEEDISFKQIIPYAIISCKEPEGARVPQNQSFYLFKRTSGQTEKRLLNKYHLGAGGHVNPCGSIEPGAQNLIDELKRELFEEIKFSYGCLISEIGFVGFINDDSIPVGRVHLGLLYDIHVSNKDLFVNETDKMIAGWIDKTDLIDYYEEMETWTKIAMDYYIK